MRLSFCLRAIAFALLAGVIAGCRQPASSPMVSEKSEKVAVPVNQEANQAAPPYEAASRSLDPSGLSISISSPASSATSARAATSSAVALGGESELSAGRHCYSLVSDTSDEVIRLDVSDDRSVSGDATGTLVHEDLGHYTSYERKLMGRLDGDQLPLYLTTWIEYDVQDEQQTWTVTPQQITTDGDQFTAIDCAAVQERFLHASGLEAGDLTEHAASVRRKRIMFAPGTSSTTIENSVVRGDRNVYFLRARGGQMMTLSIASQENNAVFDVVTPSGIIMATEAETAEFLLPHTGEYEVIVGGTRGNASYALDVEIK